MIAKAGQIIAIDSVKVDNTLSGDGVRTPLGVKATAPAVSGHAGLSAEKVDNTVYIGMEPDAVKVVSTDETVSIEKTVKSDGTVEYNLGVSVEPVVSDTKIIGSNGISARETAPATYTIGVSGDYVKSETLNDYYIKADADATFQKKGEYVTSADASLNDKQLVLKNNKWEEVDAGTDYTAGDNIDITNDVISGRDWTPELAQKADKSDLVGLATKTWVGENFVPDEVLDDYYTSDNIDDLLVNYALSADVDTAIDESEANIAYWANNRFQLSGNYASATDITSLSSTVETNFQKKGKYVTSAENPAYEGKALVLKDNQWVVAPEGTVYTPGQNIDITNNVISGRDWSPELDKKANTSDLEGLATQDDLVKLSDAIAENLAEELEETSAWANRVFQPKGNYLTDDALEDYYTKSEVNDKVQDLANEFDSVIDSVSATIDRDFALKSELEEKLDKSVTTNWDVKEYSAGENITIQNHKISGKDWSTEIDAKQDKLTDKQLSAISSVSAIEAMSGKWVTSGVDVISGNYYYGLVNKNGTVEWEPIPEPEPDYPDIVGNNGISAAYDSDKNAYDIGLSADYALKSELPDVTDMATKTWVGLQGYLTSVPDSYATKAYANEASANALSEAESWVGQHGFITKDVNNLTYYYKKTETSSTSEITNALSTKLDSTVAEQTYQPKGNYATTSDISDMATQTWVGQCGFITKDVNDLTYYYKKTETSGTTELSTEFTKKVNNPDTSLTDKYLVLRTDTNGAVSGWCNFNDKIYSKTESDGRYMQKNTDSILSGDGTTNSPLGIDSDNFYELDTAGNYLTSQTSNQKTIISTTPALDNAISRVSTSADVWDTVTAKSTVTVNTANNEIKVNNNANSAISAVSYDICEVGEPDLIPQKLIVGTSSGAFVSYVTGGKCNGMGTLFFWLESQQPWNPVNE